MTSKVNDSSSQRLVEFWNKGMTGLGTREQRALGEEASASTGLTRQQIRNWQSNYRKKLLRQSSGAVQKVAKRKVHANGRKMSARDLFFTRHFNDVDMTNCTAVHRLSTLSAQWKQCSVEDKKSLQNEADVISAENANRSTFTAEEKALFVRNVVQKINSLIVQLEDVGAHGMCLVYSSSNGETRRCGTKRGLSFLESRADFTVPFIAHVTDGTACQTAAVKSREGKRKLVQDLFNKCYLTSMGENRVQYGKVESGLIEVMGLPDGMRCKKPSSYSLNDLDRILSGTQITFRATNINGSSLPLGLTAASCGKASKVAASLSASTSATASLTVDTTVDASTAASPTTSAHVTTATSLALEVDEFLRRCAWLGAAGPKGDPTLAGQAILLDNQ